ncbi:MAG: Spy/CpxP family protein refolding chaperone [Telluria sp.]
MSTVRKHVLIALAALSLGGAAFAAEQQAPAAQGQHQQWSQQDRDAHRAEFQARRAEHMKERAQKLHDALQLSGSQEQAWNSFAASMKPAQHDAKRGEFRGMANLPAPQRMRKMIELSKQRTAMMESRLAALDSFYSVLTPQQRKVFDEQTSHGMGGHGFGHHGERGEHHEGGMRG